MVTALTKRSSSFYVSHAVVRLEVLDKDNNTLSWASGFVINEKDYLSLYTCWHVVTGVDPHCLPVKFPKKRERLRIHTAATESPAPGVTKIGGLSTCCFDLYDNIGKQLWSQKEPQEGSEGGKLHVPRWDCVRLDISTHQDKFPNAFQPDDDIQKILDVSSNAYIVGYPYGYSASDTGPYPIFLRRAPASLHGPQGFFLLDGAGAKGMSGGPIVVRVDNEWRLAGIYNGAVFPEATNFSDELDKNDSVSRLPLGKYTLLMLARGAVGVSAANMGLVSHNGT